MTSEQYATDAVAPFLTPVRAAARRLRPGKVRSAARRRLFEFQLERTRLHGMPGLVELGSSYGGWIVPGTLIDPSWVCYCVGVGGDITFDAELTGRYGATVRAFEPVKAYVAWAEQQAAGEPRFSVHQLAVAAADGPIRMQMTHHPQSRSVSPVQLYESEEYVELPGRSLPSLMREFGDERIDLLKLDIEGGEYELLPTLDLAALGVKVFSTQLHHVAPIWQARRLVTRLQGQGYEPVACRSAVKLTFVRHDLLGEASTDEHAPRRASV